MSNNRSRLLRLLLRQPTRHTNFETGLRLPACVSWIDAKTEWESFQAGNEDALGETLLGSRLALYYCEEGRGKRGRELERRTNLIYHVSQYLILIFNSEFLRINDFLLQCK
jgi:hypothetical protein